MQSLQEWAFAVCCTCVIGTMLTMVAPTGSSRRLFSMIVTLMTLCVLFRSFSAAGDWARRVTQYTFEESALENPALEAEVESGAKRVYAAYLKDSIVRLFCCNHFGGVSAEVEDQVPERNGEEVACSSSHS